MRANRQSAALASALALLGVSGAEASIITPISVGGSEIVATFVNRTTGASIAQDLGVQRTGLNIGDSFNLDAGVISFILATGVADLDLAVIGGGAPNGTSAGSYIQSSANGSFNTLAVANSTKGTWLSNLGNYVTNLNNTNPGDTNTAVNNGYGPFNAGPSPNFIGGNHNKWGTAASNLNNLGAATNDLFLYVVNFAASFTGNSVINPLEGGAKAFLNLNSNQLQIVSTAAVPVPAAVWLFGSALGVLGGLRRLRQQG